VPRHQRQHRQRHADDRQRTRRRHHLRLPDRQHRHHRPGAARRYPDECQRRQPDRRATQRQLASPPATTTPGAPGSNSGDLGVTFTAANAGALAPLSGPGAEPAQQLREHRRPEAQHRAGGGAAAYNAAVGAATPSPRWWPTSVSAAPTRSRSPSATTRRRRLQRRPARHFGANTGAAQNNGGIINALVAGGLNAGTMSVGVNAGSAGAKTGTVTLNYQTTGTVNGVSNGLAAGRCERAANDQRQRQRLPGRRPGRSSPRR
jgi:hypothetical protein